MTFEIWKTSDYDEANQFVIDIDTLEELMELIEKTERKRIVFER